MSPERSHSCTGTAWLGESTVQPRAESAAVQVEKVKVVMGGVLRLSRRLGTAKGTSRAAGVSDSDNTGAT